MTSHTFVTFGWTSGSLDERAREVEQALGVTLEPRDSLYRGEYYNYRGEGPDHIILQQNFIEDDDGLPTDNEHPRYVVLLYASDLPSGWDERIGALDGVDRLAER